MPVSTKWTLSGLLVWCTVLAAMYLWWLVQDTGAITKHEFDAARRVAGTRDGLLGLLVANDLTAPNIIVHPYPQIFVNHSSSAVLSQNLKSRCNLYFSRWRQPPMTSDEAWVFDSFSDFKRNERVIQLYSHADADDSNYAYLDFAQRLYGDAIKDRQLQEESLAELLSSIRVYHQCYLRQNGHFLHRQLRRIAKIKDRIDLGINDMPKHSQLKLELAIFPWLTGVIPQSANAKVIPSNSRMRVDKPDLKLAQVMGLWSGKGTVILDDDKTDALISHIRQLSDLPIQVITTSKNANAYGPTIETIYVGDSYQDLELLPLVAAFFSTFAQVTVITSSDVSIDALSDFHLKGEVEAATIGRLWSQLRPSRYDEVIFGLEARALPLAKTQLLVIHIDKHKYLEVLLLLIELQRQPATRLLVAGNEMWWGHLVSSV